MRPSFHLAVLALLLLPAGAPAAEARAVCVDPANVCAGDLSTCSATSPTRSTGARVNPTPLVYASAFGQSNCASGESSVKVLYALAGEENGGVSWGPAASGCILLIDLPRVYRAVPCGSATPPDPGWGHVLP